MIKSGFISCCCSLIEVPKADYYIDEGVIN